MTLGKRIFERIFDRRVSKPLEANDLFLGIRAHLGSYAQDKKLKLVCASCSQEFANLRLMNEHRKESHD